MEIKFVNYEEKRNDKNFVCYIGTEGITKSLANNVNYKS